MASYQPWPCNYTYQALDIPLARDGGIEDITNVQISAFTMTFRNSVGVDTIGTGTFSLKTANPAEVYYKFSPADVANPFNGSLIVKAFGPPSNSNADELVWDSLAFVISPS